MKAPREEVARIIAQSRFDVNEEFYEQKHAMKRQRLIDRSMELSINDSHVWTANGELLNRCVIVVIIRLACS
jgi:hypothetical protein